MEKRLTLVCFQRSESAANWLCCGVHKKAGQSGQESRESKTFALMVPGTSTEREQFLGASLDVLLSDLTKMPSTIGLGRQLKTSEIVNIP